MKVCEICGEGKNRCQSCERKYLAGRRAVEKAKRNRLRRERDQAMRDLGLVKVRGAMGGTYWE